jgi:putative oxygen-independent coproporphyrinogen III oxidase
VPSRSLKALSWLCCAPVTTNNGANSPPGLYVHVPFCKTKCPYCDFFSVTDLSGVSRWLSALEREAALYRDSFTPFDSLYVGGGTPTVLESLQLQRLFAILRAAFTFVPGAEVTVEANPDDVTPEKLDELRTLGVNRLSIGVQSFNDGELRFLRRRHDGAASRAAITMARSAGFENLSVDLIYSLPGQTPAVWRKSVTEALSFEPTHLSCYQLTLEPATVFGELHRSGKLQKVGEKDEAQFFLETSRFLESRGYLHYEISNFALGPRFLSRHNRKYWRHVPYLGLGPGAHSFQNGIRWWNYRSLETYCAGLEKDQSPVNGQETLSAEQLNLERLYLRFRTSDGVPLKELPTDAGSSAMLQNLLKSGYLKRKKESVVATRRGYLIADRLPLLFTT